MPHLESTVFPFGHLDSFRTAAPILDLQSSAVKPGRPHFRLDNGLGCVCVGVWLCACKHCRIAYCFVCPPPSVWTSASQCRQIGVLSKDSSLIRCYLFITPTFPKLNKSHSSTVHSHRAFFLTRLHEWTSELGTRELSVTYGWSLLDHVNHQSDILCEILLIWIFLITSRTLYSDIYRPASFFSDDLDILKSWMFLPHKLSHTGIINFVHLACGTPLFAISASAA